MRKIMNIYKNFLHCHNSSNKNITNHLKKKAGRILVSGFETMEKVLVNSADISQGNMVLCYLN
jgi:hypothetical protein